ncbi:hypothetical protein J416_07047 [Gracilibacillus halophilus YIM-C55.5]|uniref:Uncharacterized protein n=1 Tax=Gracilibacillus halophilus YIM-C55.5 TaxID=1308866 RepID=N4WD47_9BACI|nr:hypothetical protein [Gracilibacillus halophilus]ENH97179.1 hypothetical protein J416_07047 [Gracilibacillus halophilus YIM-C55.5]
MNVLGVMLYVNALLIVSCYMYVYRDRTLIGFQLGMNISMMAGSFLAMSTGVILIYQFPLQFAMVTIISVFVGMITGSLFGALFDYQTLLTGYVNGVMVGMMAPMIGAAANFNLQFVWLMESVLIISLLLIVSSSRYG